VAVSETLCRPSLPTSRRAACSFTAAVGFPALPSLTGLAGNIKNYRDDPPNALRAFTRVPLSPPHPPRPALLFLHDDATIPPPRLIRQVVPTARLLRDTTFALRSRQGGRFVCPSVAVPDDIGE